MSRETFQVGILSITADNVCGRPIRSQTDIHGLAEKVLNLLRTEKIPICQVKDVMDRVCMLVDLEPLTKGQDAP